MDWVCFRCSREDESQRLLWAPPPQADGKKIFCPESVDNNDEPAGAVTGLASSPLMMIFTGPDWTNLD